MRLLACNDKGDFYFTTFFGAHIPRYAILSHTWEVEEVMFEDINNGRGQEKKGYTKIAFCGEQARRDGLQYFWVDTCCIDKSSSSELTEAINSMFRWYREAAKCYVYLSDVSRPLLSTNDQSHQPPWESAFRKSRWFTRGWTLQELIAPKLVKFFEKDGELLGNKISLERHISEVSGIPVKTLRGSALSSTSVAERMSWADERQTTREEDKVYSLLGIFDVQMPLIYGEGKEKALKRLWEEIGKATKEVLTEIGIQREDYSIAFSLSNVSGIEHFVAREKELGEIHENLIGNSCRRIVVLHGLGGIGKTQLSIAYAKRYKDNYSAIFWLNIKDEDSLKQSFVKIAKQILREHPSAGLLKGLNMKENLDEVVDAVKVWLSHSNNTCWLLIYDNYDNPKIRGNRDRIAVDIREYLPDSHQGSVIITTRSAQLRSGHRIKIEKFNNIQDSLRILSYESQREDAMNDPDALILARKLDGLPLALATAGAYLDQVSTSFSEYLRLFNHSWLKLLQSSPDLDSYGDRALYTTWNLSFNHVKKQNILSAKLLQLWAYFDNQDVWFELLRHVDSNFPTWFSDLVGDEVDFTEAMRMLCDHGLVEVEKSSEEQIEAAGYSMHGCVHSWTIHVLNREWDDEMAKLALKCVGSHLPKQNAQKGWVTQRRILRHALRCSKNVLKGLISTSDLEWALDRIGSLYRDQGKLKEAEKIYQRALIGYEKTRGPDHISTLHTVNNLGLLYVDLGRLEEAEKMYQRALFGTEKAWGAEHKSTLDTVNNLGILYVDLGRIKGAEKMYQRALIGYEKAWGPEHTSTLTTVNNLGILYAKLGKLIEAEEMYHQALVGKEKALGPEHTSTLDTVHNIGILYVKLGKLVEAEEMYQRALIGYEKAWGPEHTSTLDTVNNLGNLYAKLGKLVEAEEMYQRALIGYKKAWGPEHTSTLTTVNNLGVLYVGLGRLEEAEKMYQRVLIGYEKAWGLEHTSTLTTVHNLGILYAKLGKLIEAEEMYQQALVGREKVLGPEHTSTLDTVHNIGILYAKLGKLVEAEEMYQRALVGYEKAWGPEHTSTLTTANNLGTLYVKLGKLVEAEEMYQRALQGYEKALGAENVTTNVLALTTIWNIGLLFESQAELTKARIVYTKALAGNEKVFGSDHSRSLELRDRLRALQISTEN